MNISIINKWVGVILIMLSIGVSIPLAIHTFQTDGGPWGFGVMGLPILIPLSAYILFGMTAWFKKEAMQRRIFIAAHVITITIGIVSIFAFPIYPKLVILLPLVLATLGIVDKRNLKYYLFTMIVLAIAANVVLLKWELDFGRTLPLLQLFESSTDAID